ncbi:MAG: hypothetical protein IT464_12655 [Planctomycetes bacterium]|nr:hypothetical protein [Planctomycetota bacterium]
MIHGQMQMMPPAPGHCRACFVKHDATMAHNQQSLSYQMRFYAEHRRWPTWDDAVAHLDEATRALWLEHVERVCKANGVPCSRLPEGVDAIAEPVTTDEDTGTNKLIPINLRPVTINGTDAGPHVSFHVRVHGRKSEAVITEIVQQLATAGVEVSPESQGMMRLAVKGAKAEGLIEMLVEYDPATKDITGCATDAAPPHKEA